MISELNVFIPAMIISFCGCALIMFAIAIEKKHLYLYLIMFVYAGMLLPGITYTIAKESFLIVLVVNLISVIYNVVLVYFSFSEEAKEHSFLERTPIRTIAKIPASAVAFTFFEFLVKFVVTKL